MTTIEQAKAVEQRLREGISIATERDIYSGFIPVAKLSADTIASLIAGIEEAQKDAARYRAIRKATLTEDDAFMDALDDQGTPKTEAQFDSAFDDAIAAGGGAK